MSQSDRTAPPSIYSNWEKIRQAEQAQKEYAANRQDIEAFPAPVMQEPVSIEDAAMSPTGIKQIQLDLNDLKKHLTEWETTQDVYHNFENFKH